MENAAAFKKQVEHLEIERDELQRQIVNLQEQASDSDNLTSSSQLAKIQELTEECEKSQREVERLRQFLVEMEETQTHDAISLQTSLEDYKQQIVQLESTREELQQVASQEQDLRKEIEIKYQQSKADLNDACAESQTLRTKLLAESSALENLQKVLGQFQTSIFILQQRKSWRLKKRWMNLVGFIRML
jgi:chromosome segregation ATPase